jgi:hypothetical protein
MRRVIVIGLMLAVGCNLPESVKTADKKDAEQQSRLQKEAQAEMGMPAVHNFQEKKLLKQIYELRDNEKLVCYAYLYNEMQGKLVYIGKCLGYGIPYSTQYSNPMRPAESFETHEQGNITLPQCEPNGLFMPSSSEGTWLMMIDEKGEPHPVYVEPRVIVSPFKLSF